MISVRNLRYTYRGSSSAALRGIEFDVRPGEVFGFLGPSGAGKSTTQKVLTGLLAGYHGEVRVFGRSLAELGRDYYERIGVSFEFPNVYGKLTGRENLEFFRSLYRERTAEPDALFELVGLSDAADQRVASYSKGMKMRLNVCRALLANPELLFLDEPTSGQDPVNARRIRDLIRARRDAGATVFLTTHDMWAAADLCDRVAFIVDGRIAAVDAPHAFMVRHGRRRLRVEHRTAGATEVSEFDLDGLGQNQEFLRLLQGNAIDAMHTLDATLEDVFIELTGRRIE